MELEEDQNKENVSTNIRVGKMSNSRRVFKPRPTLPSAKTHSEKTDSLAKEIREEDSQTCSSFSFQIKLPTTNL